MDGTTYLKSLLLAVRQYAENRTAVHAAHLQKQVEAVSSLSGALLSPVQLLLSQCVDALMELIGNTNTCHNLTGSVISMLAHLAHNAHTQLVLRSSFSVISSLTEVILHNSDQSLQIQCLQLLQRLTYNTPTLPPTNHLHQLVLFLISNIESQTDDIITPCLGLMANLCRENQSVQAMVRSQDNVRIFYRTLLNFLDHSRLTVVVFSLSVLASLTLNEKVGEKLFGPNNIHQTFQLVFNIIINGDGSLTREYSVDLLIDLLKCPKIADHLSSYEHFSTCLTQVSALLQNKEPDSASKVLELLMALSVVPSLRLLLCQILFKPVGAKLGVLDSGRACKAESGHRLDISLTLLQWLSSPVEGAESCVLQAVRLLRELLEGALPDSTLNFLEVLLPVVMELLNDRKSPGDADLIQVCRRSVAVWSLLRVLCLEDRSRVVLSRHISAQLCLHQVEILLSCCHSNQPLTCAPPNTDDDISHMSSDAVLTIMELMSKLREEVPDMETSFYRVLQDPRMVTPLSMELTSPVPQKVHCALSLLFEASSLPDFPVVLLGEGVAANNAFRQRSAELSTKHMLGREDLLLNSGSMTDLNGTVCCLVEKIQDRLEVKDSCVSEIIDVYEHKLSALAAKEKYLQDLLDCKSAALSQADRVIAQFRLQRAQAEAERSRLGALLKASERRKEQLHDDLSSQLLLVERSKADTEELLQHNARLQRDSEQHHELREAYNLLLHRFSDSEQQLKDLQTAHLSLTKLSDAQKRNFEALQLQHSKQRAALTASQDTIVLLQEELQRKQAELSGVCEQLQLQQLKLKRKEEEMKELEESNDSLRKDLSRTEQSRREASIKASSLELQREQLELKLKTKEDELNKHSAMIAMIHSLSSGKGKSDGNLSL